MARTHGFEVRIHGRGGQGVVTAAELLSMAAFTEGRHAQAFPSFGSERTGAPVVSFCRIADAPIRTREPVVAADAIVVQDATLLHQHAVLDGLRPDGFLLVNTARRLDELGLDAVVRSLAAGRARAVAATDLALRHTGRAVPNAVLLGAFAALTGVVSVHSVLVTILDRFEGVVAQQNAAAAIDAYRLIRPAEELPRAASA